MSERDHPTLSVNARQRLEACEAVIDQGLRTFFEVGKALTEIRDDRLYQENYQSFEGYCLERWNISRPHAYRLIDAAEVVQNLSPIGDIPLHESQLRPLKGLSPEQQRDIWAKATAKSPNPTASEVQAAVGSLADGETQPASKDGRVTVSLGTIECPMSPEDTLYSLGHDYERQVCKLIETRAETQSEIRALIVYLSTDLDLRKASIRDYFAPKTKDDLEASIL